MGGPRRSLSRASATYTPDGDKCARLLCLDGGGIRGVLEARILKHLDEALKGAGKAVPLADRFHVVAGTSTGGILASALYAGMSIDQVVDLYSFNNCKRIFSKWRMNPLQNAAYDAAPLEQMLAEKLGDKKLYVDDESKEKKYTATGIELVIPAYKLSKTKTTVFRSWKRRRQDLQFFKTDPGHRGDPKPPEDYFLREICRATSAAPTYFPTAVVRDNEYVDGGVYANNPAGLALTESQNLFQNARRFVVVSIGTGEVKKRDVPSLKKPSLWNMGDGMLRWIKGGLVMDVMMDGTADATHRQLATLAKMCRNSAQKFEYFRIQVQMDDEIKLDDYKRVPDLEALVDNPSKIYPFVVHYHSDFAQPVSGKKAWDNLVAALRLPKCSGDEIEAELIAE